MSDRFFLFGFILLLLSCSDSSNDALDNSLKSYIDSNNNKVLDNVIACAASENTITNIFYYPIIGATDIRYYQTENSQVNKDDFSKYKRIHLSDQPVFGGKLRKFIKTDLTEAWCVVTYLTDGKLHVSNAIKLKNNSLPTEFSEEVIIDYPSSLMPKFTWQDGVIDDNVIYFQVISDENDNFISGTYTVEKTFQFYNTSNLALNINTELPQSLELGKQYHFTMMGVSEDNWVNLIIKKPFIAE